MVCILTLLYSPQLPKFSISCRPRLSQSMGRREWNTIPIPNSLRPLVSVTGMAKKAGKTKMSHDAKSEGGSFDLDRLQKLVELMEKFDLREVRLSRGDEKWFLRRGPQEVVQAIPAAVPMAMPAAPAPVAASAPAAAAAPPAAAPQADAGLVPIKSPAVGTFYVAAAPGEKPFVKVGDRISKDSTVCIVEAMKTMNPIPAGISGTIARVVLNDGDTVEFGQPLFMVKPD